MKKLLSIVLFCLMLGSFSITSAAETYLKLGDIKGEMRDSNDYRCEDGSLVDDWKDCPVTILRTTHYLKI